MPRPDSGKLGGLVRRKLIRELALKMPDVTYTEIAKRYNVTQAAISQFAKKHADEIAAVAKDADDQFAGLLIADKAHRLALLQEIVEKAGVPAPKVTNAGRVAYDDEGNMITEIDVRAQMQALKQAAEELGQLPTRVQLTGTMDTTTTYRIVNVTDDDLT